jgi:tripartite-type tricarboxylate transporter receptor subunit TctC
MTYPSCAIGRRAVLAGACGALAASGLPRLAGGQDAYPGSQAVSIVMPYAPGGSMDVLGRVLTQGLSERLGGTFVLDHKPGASTTLAGRHVARARPDGATLLMGTSVTFTMVPFALRNPGFDALADFAHVTMIGDTLFLLVANPRWRSLDEVVAEAKRRPGALTYATWGVGTSSHLLMLDLMARAGIELLHVPFNGAPPALTETLAGRVDLMFSTFAPAKPHVEAGRLRAFGTPAAERVAALPEVPTLVELGHRGFVGNGWFTLSAPAGTPQPVLNRLEEATVAILADPAVRARLDGVGLVASPPGAKAARERIVREAATNRELMRRAGIEPE